MIDDDRQHRLLVAMLRTEHEVIRACNRVYKRFGVTYHQFQVLRILEAEDKPLPQGTIGEHLLVSRANLSGLIDRLVSSSLVKRRSTRKDRRVVLVDLTTRGRDVLRSVEPVRDTVESLLMAGVEAGEADQIIALLDGMAERAEQIG
jgi:DNA-binding MarR family transcriptional regulator